MSLHSRAPFLLTLAGLLLAASISSAQEEGAETYAAPRVRGSIIEDRAARKLLEAGDARIESDETTKAVEIWQSVIERYPRSRYRFDAHMRLGNYFLERDRAYDRARVHFQSAASEENRDEAVRAEATLRMGMCFYEARNFGKSFSVMREVIEKFPVSPQVNGAYYYIGLGHFQLGHYSRAIDALEKVGTTLAGTDEAIEKVEAGKRLFVKIEDADLAALEPGTPIEVQCETGSGDVEIVKCYSVGRNVRLVLGSIPTELGVPQPKNGTLEVKGDDQVRVIYIDQHTADKTFDRPVDRKVTVVGDGVVAITDGAFGETLQGVVLGKSVNIQITDADRDQSGEADTIEAVAEVYRRKTDEEIEAELISSAATTEGDSTATTPRATDGSLIDDTDDRRQKIDRLKLIDRVAITLQEVRITRRAPTETEEEQTETPTAGSAETPTGAGSPADAMETGPIHTGVFRVVVPLVNSSTPDQEDNTLQAETGDLIRVTWLDEKHTGEGVRSVIADARCVEGNLGGVRVTRSVISDQELRIRTRLKTAEALTNIGNRYKEFGLKTNASAKYDQALAVCDEVMRDARVLGGGLLEQTYVQLWKVYYEMDNLPLAAAMAQRLQRDFPNSGFVDDALLQLADVARKQGDLRRAIGIYSRLVAMETSQLRGEAQFGIAQCYELMAEAATDAAATQLYDRSFQEYKKVFDNFPDSGRVGEAVAKMANYYYQQKDYARAVDTFETVLGEYPDARFLDVILFNYGRCLYRMNRRNQARQRFDQLIGEFPESPLAADAKKISDALAKAGF